MQTMQLVIGNKNYSSWSLRPWLVLKQLGIRFEEIRIPLFTDSFKQQISQYSGATKVPVLCTGQQAVPNIWESSAICEYLAERHPELWPEDAGQRALARSVTAEMHAGFSALRNELPMNCRAAQRSLRYSDQAAADIRRIEALWQQCRQQRTEPGAWLLGRFGIVDAFYAPVVIRFNAYQVPLSESAREYCQHWLASPHLQQWIEEGCAEVEVIAEEEVGEADEQPPLNRGCPGADDPSP